LAVLLKELALLKGANTKRFEVSAIDSIKM